MPRRLFEVRLVVSVLSESEYSARRIVGNWLEEQQKAADEKVDIIHDVRVEEEHGR